MELDHGAVATVQVVPVKVDHLPVTIIVVAGVVRLAVPGERHVQWHSHRHNACQDEEIHDGSEIQIDVSFQKIIDMMGTKFQASLTCSDIATNTIHVKTRRYMVGLHRKMRNMRKTCVFNP